MKLKAFISVLILSMSMLSVNAKENSYESSWKKVEEYQKKSLPVSAQTEVDKIYNQAVKDKNNPQIVKTLMFKIQQSNQNSAEGTTGSFQVTDLEKITDEATDPVMKAVLHSVLADVYAQQYRDNRYQIDSRTNIQGYIPQNMNEWSANIFQQKICEHINASLLPATDLQKMPATKYSDVLQLGEDSRELRPTMFDLLSYRALNQLSINSFSVDNETNPLLNKDYFADASVFINIPVKNDSCSYIDNMVSIYQGLLKFHSKGDKNALLYSDLQRLKFVYNYSEAENKDNLYLQQLDKLEKAYADNPFSVEIMIDKATYLYNNASSYADDKTEMSKQLVTAYNICTQGISKFGKYKRIDQLKNLQTQIESSTLQCTMSNNLVYPDTEILFKVQYKNQKKAVINIYKIDKTTENYETERANNSSEKQGKLMISYKIDLPEKERFVEQTMEFNIRGLVNGIYEYEIVSEDKPDNSSRQSLYVSKYTLIKRNRDNTVEYYVVDRKTGQPQPNASVKLFDSRYENNKRVYNHIATIACDLNGYVSYKYDKNQNIFAGIIVEGDSSFPLTSLYVYKNAAQSEPKSQQTVSLFTDRNIYRPGQTVYFKGIAYTSTTADVTIVKDKSYTIKLLNSNYEEVSTKTLKTNDFGSFSGEFILPQNVLSGYFTIQCDNGSYSFRVEEYKRPDMEIKFDNVQGAYTYGDTITITGEVMNYAGYSAANSSVRYRIAERSMLMRYPSRAEKDITSGTVQADENGKFSVTFVIPQQKTGNDNLKRIIPGGGYTIYAEATDIKGETQKNESYISVSNNSILLSTNLPAYVKKENAPEVVVTAQNSNGEKVDVVVNCQLFKLQPKKSIGDTAVVIDKEVFVSKLDLSKTSTLKALFNTLTSGKYRLQLTATDKKGRKNTTKTDFVFYSATDTKLADKDYVFIDRQKTTVAVGQNAEILFGTSTTNTKVLYQILKGQELIESKWLTFNDELKLLKIPYKAEYGDKVTVELIFVKDEQFFNTVVELTKQQEDKNLDVQFKTFRDKLLPGQQEEWTIKILDSKGKVVNAEFMAALYDASLDAFGGANNWYFSPQPYMQWVYLNQWDASLGRYVNSYVSFNENYKSVQGFKFDELNWFQQYNGYYGRNASMVSGGRAMGTSLRYKSEEADKMVFSSMAAVEESADAGAISPAPAAPAETPAANIASVPVVRQNFNETAFFYPQLKTNKNGEVLLSFKMPESLTRWNFMGLAHTADLQYGQLAATTVTQKPFMITANMPRFVRVDDKLTLTASIVNLTDKAVNGKAKMEFVNPVDEKVVYTKELTFSANANSTTTVSWDYTVTNKYDMLICRLTANDKQFSDGEQHMLPVLSNKIMVTESLPLNVSGKGTANFTFDSMKNNTSTTLESKRYTVEFTSNPVWYAVQALPYLSTPSSDNTISYLSAYYVNTLASYIANSNPKLAATFDQWKNQGGKDALLSNLQKNEELKNIVLEETPWVMDAKNEAEQKQQIGLLFDLNNLKNSTTYSFDKLKEMQLPTGAFTWFKGMTEDRNVTQQVLDNLIKLQKMGAVKYTAEESDMQTKAIQYLDICLKDDLDKLKKNKDYKTKASVSSTQIYYHYIRSSYKNIMVPAATKEAYNFYLDLMEKQWTKQGLYEQAMIAIVMQRNGKKTVATDIIKSLREHAQYSNELGMYWPKNKNAYYWNQSSVKTQVALIEAFAETTGSKEEIDDMKIWLLRQKQTQIWESDIATVNAIYALLMQGSDWTVNSSNATITVGGKAISEKAEAGTGYIKKTYTESEITPSLATISVTKTDDGIAWGAAYWQYLENIDKIEKQGGNLVVDKKLFVETTQGAQKAMEPITDANLKVGSKVIVRLTVRVDRDMEYVCLKDLRATCFEPSEQLSGYRWREGVGYYQTTKDASMQYFFNYLPKGTYVFEYPVWVTRAGEYSNGNASIQCQYAPEFVSHSGSEKVIVK